MSPVLLKVYPFWGPEVPTPIKVTDPFEILRCVTLDGRLDKLSPVLVPSWQ